MKKKMRFVSAILMMLSMLFVTGCGSDTAEKSPYEGKWVAVIGEMLGMQTSVEEAVGGEMSLELKSRGKATIHIAEDSGKGKWAVEGDQFTLTIDGEEMVGTIGEDTITFDDMLGMGVKMIFAKEGTDATNPALYLPEEEKAMLGEWMSETVEEVMGDGPQTSMEGVENINDALRLNFTNDHNVAVIYKGQEVGTFTWSVSLGYCMIESEEPSLYVTINDDGTLEIDYSSADDYYTFHCVKNSGE